MGTNFLPGPVVIGQGVLVLNWKRVDSDKIQGRHFLWWGRWNTGTDCPER